MKVVLDTNVLIDGLKDEYSYQKRVIDEVIAGRLDAYANKQTLQENKLLLGQLVDNPEYESQVNAFFAQVSHVANRRRVHVVRDDEDNKILESAVEAGADYLVTNDSDLLSLGEFQGVRIVRAIDFWAKYKDEGQDLWNSWAGFLSGR